MCSSCTVLKNKINYHELNGLVFAYCKMNAQDLKPFTFHCPFRQCIWKGEKMCCWDCSKLPNDSLALARNKQRKAKALGKKKKKKEIILTFYVKNNCFREELSWLKQVIYLFISWWNWYYVNLEDSWGFFTPFFFFFPKKENNQCHLQCSRLVCL